MYVCVRLPKQSSQGCSLYLAGALATWLWNSKHLTAEPSGAIALKYFISLPYTHRFRFIDVGFFNDQTLAGPGVVANELPSAIGVTKVTSRAESRNGHTSAQHSPMKWGFDFAQFPQLPRIAPTDPATDFYPRFEASPAVCPCADFTLLLRKSSKPIQPRVSNLHLTNRNKFLLLAIHYDNGSTDMRKSRGCESERKHNKVRTKKKLYPHD